MNGNIAEVASAHMLMNRIISDEATAAEKRELRAGSKARPAESVNEITECLSRASGDNPGLRYLVGCLGEAMAYAKTDPTHMHAAVDRLRQLHTLPEHQILVGSARHLEGDRKGAYAAFTAARATANGNWVFPTHRGAENIIWEDDPSWLRPAPRKRALSAPMRWLRDPSPRGFTVVFAGDKVYFRNLAANALASLEGSNVPVHFHVVGWDDAAEETLRAIDRPGVTVSTERYDYPKDFTYFATARFLRAVELMRALGPIYISDLDNVFIHDPLKMSAIYREHDAAFTPKPYQDRLPWLSPAAAYLFLNNTSRGLELAQQMANYVDHRFRPNGGRNWYFDQLLLNEVFRASEAKILRLTKATLPSVPCKTADTLKGKRTARPNG